MACTDGLTDCVPEHEIQRLAARREALPSIARDLVMEANERGGLDNTTVVLVRAAFADDTGSVGRNTPVKRRLRRSLS
jgi:serine/threonine protein phosphatase PrpC